MHHTLRKILPLGAAVLLAFSSAAFAKNVALSGDFAGENGATNNPSGHVEATLDTVTHKLSYTIKYDGLTGPVVIAHLHGPAQPGVSAGAMKLVPGPYVSGMTNTVTIDAATQSAMLSGMTYVNLHTHAYPKGEARAQMVVSSSPGM
ncbi:CHRD domain-containing protein [Rhodanobacter sp. AS-Z3]|uniref:CHRD domain-containing protein n=1 Tax=Rhodanobacter sp. AS-Z3 TaxID=3031330 RepID=UPI00247ABD49|nr:CHRD domain-containing protein [Rhodanobacter sp. AS-Z3]WEN15056.1 CHRD domain-containing protein [Rhodanobacter sp. AS-Z3]